VHSKQYAYNTENMKIFFALLLYTNYISFTADCHKFNNDRKYWCIERLFSVLHEIRYQYSAEC